MNEKGCSGSKAKLHLACYFFPLLLGEKNIRYAGKFKADILSCLSPNLSSFFYSCVLLADLAARYQNVSGW